MSETTTTKLSASHVIVGKELQMDVYHKSGVLLVKRGHYVLTEEQKQRLLANGEISKDAKMAAAERELRERREKQQEQQRKERESRGRNPLVEMDSLAHKMRGLLNHYFHVSEFEAQVTQVAQRLATLSEQQPDGLIASCLLVPFQDYGSTHSLHTAAILAVLGRRLKLPVDDAFSGVARKVVLVVKGCGAAMLGQFGHRGEGGVVKAILGQAGKDRIDQVQPFDHRQLGPIQIGAVAHKGLKEMVMRVHKAGV